jgi:hypothetical protein
MPGGDIGDCMELSVPLERVKMDHMLTQLAKGPWKGMAGTPLGSRGSKRWTSST